MQLSESRLYFWKLCVIDVHDAWKVLWACVELQNSNQAPVQGKPLRLGMTSAEQR